jgi:pyruvate dehydrogenase complex dehydrogenase (E1) component
MPRTYTPEAVRDAASLYFSGLSPEDIAKHMRNNGYPSLAVETIRRWADERGWKDERAKLAADEGAMMAALDSARITAEILSGLIQTRSQILQKRTDGQIDFVESVRLQLQIDAQIRMVLAQLKAPKEKEEAVENPPEKSIKQILEEVYGIPQD